LVQTSKDTVRGLLHQEGVALRQHDRTDPPTDSPLFEGASVVITRVDAVWYTMYLTIEPETITRGDATAAAMTQVVVQDGSAGQAVESWLAWKKDGVVTLRECFGRRVTTAAVPRIVEYRPMGSRGVAGRTMRMVATAYHPFDPGCHGITATGVRARKGIIAVDPRVIRLGTRVYVEGYGYAVAADTGGAIKGNRIDVCFESHGEVRTWGRKTVTVTILG
jgi:3D (Asp-Asp-Asp) domain-containing protein